jgi:RNA polymerase sigma-70 factor (ECF subfamily)
MGPRKDNDLDDVYGRYAPMVFRRANRLLGNEGDAWDAVHDVFVHLIERDFDLKEVAHPVTFLHRVATNHCLNKLRTARRAARRVQAFEQAGGPGTEDVVASDGGVHARDFVDRLLLALGGKQRAMEIAVYRYLDDMTLDEVADVMKVSRKTVQRDLEWIEQVAAGLEGPTPEKA